MPDHACKARIRGLIAEIFDQAGLPDRIVVVLLGLLVGIACLLDVPELNKFMPTAIDVEIPLRAASRWSVGVPVYPPSAMQIPAGPNLPYLYPPYLLPFMEPFASLPRDMVEGAWIGLGILAATWTCRRLAIPWIAVPLVLAWPPFAEGLITGNVQILCFAAFVGLLYRPDGRTLREKQIDRSGDAANGIAAVALAAAKVTQVLPIVYLARRRPRAAVLGIGALAIVGLATLPLTGVAIYGDWLAQMQRAADPHWTIGGTSIGKTIGVPDMVFAAAGVAAALTLRGRDAAAWLGIAMVIASPGVHGYTFLFLLPGLMTIRRDVAISIAAMFLGVYHLEHWWAATAMVVACLVAMRWLGWLRIAPSETDRGPERAAPQAEPRLSQADPTAAC